jgi:hypothetical protein
MGMMGQSPDNYVIMPYGTGISLSGMPNAPDTQILLTVDDIEGVDSARDRIKAMFCRLHKIDKGMPDDFRVESSES